MYVSVRFWGLRRLLLLTFDLLVSKKTLGFILLLFLLASFAFTPAMVSVMVSNVEIFNELECSVFKATFMNLDLGFTALVSSSEHL